jgi:hypothetical protein
VRGLLERDWEGARGNGGIEQHLVHATPDGRWLILAVDPGIGTLSDADDGPRQLLGAIVLSSAREVSEPVQGARSSSLQDLDAVTASELLGDLHRLSDR